MVYIFNSLTIGKMKLTYFSLILLCSGILAVPLNKSEDQASRRTIRSPIFKKKPLALLLGGIGGGTGGGHTGGGGGGNNYITNINNYGPDHQSHNPHLTGSHHEYGGESFAGSAAVAGSHGGNSQSQSASFAFGPYAASFSQSQAQGGFGKSGYDPYSDY